MDQLYSRAMIIRKGYQYRLHTKPATRQKLAQAAGALPLWKQSEDDGFLADIHSQVLQQCLKDLERAYTNCFQGRAKPRTALFKLSSGIPVL